jgi:hypothetical protein
MAREDHADVMRGVMRDRFEDEVDPVRKLPPDKREALVRSAKQRWAAGLKAAKARKGSWPGHCSETP